MFNVARRLSDELSEAEAHVLMGLVLANHPQSPVQNSQSGLDCLERLLLVTRDGGAPKPTQLGKMVAFYRYSSGQISQHVQAKSHPRA